MEMNERLIETSGMTLNQAIHKLLVEQLKGKITAFGSSFGSRKIHTWDVLDVPSLFS